MADPQAYDATQPRYLPRGLTKHAPTITNVLAVVGTPFHCRGCRDAYVRDVLEISPTRFAQIYVQHQQGSTS